MYLAFSRPRDVQKLYTSFKRKISIVLKKKLPSFVFKAKTELKHVWLNKAEHNSRRQKGLATN